MRVVRLPVSDAEGGLLLHTHRLPGAVLPKGTVLTTEACRQLAAAGVSEVMVAHLEPGEVDEDVAAERLARASAGSGTVQRPARTGRCNLHATHTGLLQFEPARLDAANLCDWRLTVATLPALRRVERGEIVATIKVLPFAVPETVLQTVEATVAGPDALLCVHAFRPLRAGLVTTHLPGTTPARSARAVEAQRVRMTRIGGTLACTESCAHRTEAVQGALEKVWETGVDLVLFLGASSVTGLQDVLPQALRALGGEVEHIGMPVDPGNLLLLGRLRGRPILGVPGCARSARTTGLDWVLERLAAGLAVTPRDLMTLGAGGLLSPSRPSSGSPPPGGAP